MPLAWFSRDTEDDEKRVYHVCLDCQHNPKIFRENLMLLSAHDNVESLTERVVCEDCREHQHEHADWRIRRKHHQRCKAYFSEQVEIIINQTGSSRSPQPSE